MTKSRGIGRGGARPGSGPKAKPKAPAVYAMPPLPSGAQNMTASDLAKLFVAEAFSTLSAISGAGASETARVAAAKVIIEHAYGKPANSAAAKGKKAEREDRARAASTGKFAPPAPPKLVVNNGG